MTTGSRGDLAVQEWQKAEGQRARAVTEENAQRDERLDQIEAIVEDLRAEVTTLWGAYQTLAKKL